MFSQIKIINNPSSQEAESSKLVESLSETISLSSSEGWLHMDEPEIMNYLKVQFYEKIAFFSDVDLYLHEIEAFSHVLLKCHGVEALFIAIPYDKLDNGTIGFYNEGSSRLQMTHDDTSAVIAKKLATVEVPAICLKPPKNVDCLMVQKNFRHIFQRSVIYGLPYLFQNYDTIDLDCSENVSLQVKFPSAEEKSFARKEGSFLGQTKDLSCLSKHEFFSSGKSLETFKSFSNSSFDDVTSQIKDMNLSQIEIGCNFTDTPSHSSFKASTPRKKEDEFSPLEQSSGRKRGFKNKRKSKILRPPLPHFSEPLELYYWVSNKSQIDVEGMLKTVRKESTETTASYFKSSVYYSLKTTIERKITINRQGCYLKSAWTGLLISGLPGTGKNLIIKTLACELNLPTISVSLLEWLKSDSSDSYLDQRFIQAKNCAPSILLLDELDSFCCKGSHGNTDIFSKQIFKIFQKSKILSTPVILVATTNMSGSVPEKIKQVGNFDKEIVLPLPRTEARLKILTHSLNGRRNALEEADVKFLAEKALGFSGSDLDSAIRIGCQNAVRKWKDNKMEENVEVNNDLTLALGDLEQGLEIMVPCFLKEKISTAPKRVQWSDIWGYKAVKEKLRKMGNAEFSGMTCLKGILLYGPPGCSKTMLVRALASETNFTFFPVKCSNLLSKYVGDTEKSLCDLFEKAALSSPSLIFIDEVDSLCGKRCGKGVDSSIITELLSLLRKTCSASNVLIVGATNRPQAVDESLLSPGCFELLLHVDLPDCSARCAIWEGLLKDVPQGKINIETLCQKSEGYSCAEICSMYQKATYTLLERLHRGKSEEVILEEKIVLNVISSSSPQTSKFVLSAINNFKYKSGNKEVK